MANSSVWLALGFARKARYWLIVLSLLPARAPTLAAEAPIQALSPPQVDEVVDRLSKELDGYVFPDVAKQIQQRLRERRETYRSVTSAPELASVLTDDMRAVGKDKHLTVTYGEELGVRKAPSPEEKQRAHLFDARNGYGFRSVRRLPGNVGYLDLAYFSPDPDAGTQLAAAMQMISGTDALIIDLRRNGGGSGETADALLSYLFEDPVELPSPVERISGRVVERQHWTMPFVTGPRYLVRPLFVLTGIHTHSAAELCAYAIQTMHRGRVVGERSSGEATSATGEVDLGQGFTAFIANGQMISPITHTNWLYAGVQPDMPTSVGDEFRTAYRAALEQLPPSGSVELDKERAMALSDPRKAVAEE